MTECNRVCRLIIIIIIYFAYHVPKYTIVHSLCDALFTTIQRYTGSVGDIMACPPWGFRNQSYQNQRNTCFLL